MKQAYVTEPDEQTIRRRVVPTSLDLQRRAGYRGRNGVLTITDLMIRTEPPVRTRAVQSDELIETTFWLVWHACIDRASHRRASMTGATLITWLSKN